MFVSDGPAGGLSESQRTLFLRPSWGLPLRGGALWHRANPLSCGFVEKGSLDSPKTFSMLRVF
ncbi:MAG TPA: hypothetical protein DCS48_05020 [Desulfovibrio sp.]|nr:hypothetical protein [Desulfovibrio sp.]